MFRVRMVPWWACGARSILFRALLVLPAISAWSTASASWLSDRTGINIDVPAGRVQIGTPRPEAIIPMIQNAPRDLVTFLANPQLGAGLAFVIRQAKAQAQRSAVPISSEIRRQLAPYFPSDILDSVRWTTQDRAGISITEPLIRHLNNAAVTLDDVVVFRMGNSSEELWAHELTHVMQYRRLGIEGFAAVYASPGSIAIEAEAYQYAQVVLRGLNQTSSQPMSATLGYSVLDLSSLVDAAIPQANLSQRCEMIARGGLTGLRMHLAQTRQVEACTRSPAANCPPPGQIPTILSEIARRQADNAAAQEILRRQHGC